jgi:hypothetical protein
MSTRSGDLGRSHDGPARVRAAQERLGDGVGVNGIGGALDALLEF